MDFDRKAVGRRIRSGRIDLGWSQEELATAAAVSQNTINSIESGRRGMTLEVAIRIADAFGWPLDRLAVRGSRVGE